MHRQAIGLAMLFTSSYATAQEIDFVQQVLAGGVGIMIILALSILMVAVTLERLVHFRQNTVVPDLLLTAAKPLWERKEYEALGQMLNLSNSTFARVLQYIVTHRSEPAQLIEDRAADMASLELRTHQQKAYALAVVATVAPIVGLLGTVIGMIESFHVIAYSGAMGDPTLLAGGISKALINTAAGLSVALPSLALHHFFKNRQVLYGLALERSIQQVMREWFAPPEGTTCE